MGEVSVRRYGTTLNQFSAKCEAELYRTLTQTEITSPPQLPELGSLRHLYLQTLSALRPRKNGNAKLQVAEGVRVLIEDDRRRGASEGALRAGVLVRGQAVHRLA